MKPIKVCDKNAEAIEAALLECNGWARVYVFNSYADIKAQAKVAEREGLKLLGLKKYLPGMRFSADSGKRSAKFTGRIKHTCVKLERRPGGWYLIELYCLFLFSRHAGGHTLYLTKLQDDLAKKLFSFRYVVID